MAVIIENRDKPKDCAHCWHHFECDLYSECLAQNIEEYINSDCPLQQYNHIPVEMIDMVKKDIEAFADEHTHIDADNWNGGICYASGYALGVISKYSKMYKHDL